MTTSKTMIVANHEARKFVRVTLADFHKIIRDPVCVAFAQPEPTETAASMRAQGYEDATREDD